MNGAAFTLYDGLFMFFSAHSSMHSNHLDFEISISIGLRNIWINEWMKKWL